MWLVNVKTKRLENFYGDPTEPYAILSHTWGKPEEELSFQDMRRLDELGDVQRMKLDKASAQAQQDGFKYIWIDTCCIDKTNAVELSEAITSMFRWYKKSAMCYTYLSDVKQGKLERISKSRWFTRGWTLQELLASPRMTFFDEAWKELGTKSSLSWAIIAATGIPHHILTGLASIDSASVAQKMSWASRRTTTRPEDMAYCLFGIFDIAIPPLYGEGLGAAFEKLQEAIMRKYQDDSIFAWDRAVADEIGSPINNGLPAISGGVLAPSPAAFQGCGDIVQRGLMDTRIHVSQTLWGKMPVTLVLDTKPAESKADPSKLNYGYLSCGPRNLSSEVIAIPLIQCDRENTRTRDPPTFLRPRDSKVVCLPRPTKEMMSETILVRKDRAQYLVLADDKSYWFYLPGPYPGNSTIQEVYPDTSYEREKAMIKTPPVLDKGPTVFLVRFSPTSQSPESFLLVLEFYPDSAQGKQEPRASLYFDGPTPLSEVENMWPSLSQSCTSEIHSAHEPLTIQVQVSAEVIDGHSLWTVNFSDKPLPRVDTLTIPRGWPDIAEQIKLRAHGIDLFQHLLEGATLDKQYQRLEDQRMRLREAEGRIADELNKVRHAISRLTARAQVLEGDRLRNKKEWSTFDLLVDRHTEQIMKYSETMRAIQVKEEKGLRKVWESTGLLDHTKPPEPEWAEARRRARNGIVAYIMKHHPSFDGGPELPWVPGTTLLMYAAASGDRSFVKVALGWDDDFNARDSRGRTVFDWAKLSTYDPSDVLEYLDGRRLELEQNTKDNTKPPAQEP